MKTAIKNIILFVFTLILLYFVFKNINIRQLTDYIKTINYKYIPLLIMSILTALFFRAFADEKLGKFNFARADYEQILKVVPTHFETRLCLLLLNQRDSHLTEAFDQANQLVALYPDSASVYFARAGVEKEMEMLELAEGDYVKALDIDKNNNDYLLALMETRLYMAKFDLAYADLEALIKRGLARASLQNYFDMCARRIVPKKQKRK